MESIRTSLLYTPSGLDDKIPVPCLYPNPYVNPEVNLVRFLISTQSFSKRFIFRPSKTIFRTISMLESHSTLILAANLG